MARQLNVILDDHEHEQLTKSKGEQTWHDFVMTLVRR